MEAQTTKRKKIGIMGGTFDPIHYGHLMIAENAARQFQLDQVYFVPTGKSPHKNDACITDDNLRCEMIQIAIQDNDNFCLSTIEMECDEISYTYRTMKHLKERDPDTLFYFIMGADSLFDFEKWKEPEEILSCCSILAAVRDNLNAEVFQNQIAYLCKKFDGVIYPLRTPNYGVSSHNIRSRIQRGETVRYLLPREVENYIRVHQLYQERR